MAEPHVSFWSKTENTSAYLRLTETEVAFGLYRDDKSIAVGRDPSPREFMPSIQYEDWVYRHITRRAYVAV